jgi:Ca-activated chloride channel family protein
VIDGLEANGSTNGGEGIQRAYDIGLEHFRKGGVNRVILCTDGDFNVGITDQNDLVRLIEQKAKSGLFLSVLGFGMGNLKDSTMEKLADKGNGNYAYIDTLDEAHKVLVEQLSGTLITIAKDVKVQIEFNPGYVRAYRLIGYENRALRKEDFHDDKKDAGDVGAGHTVTALYEIVPAPRGMARLAPDELKYQRSPPPATPRYADELLTLKLRYKMPNADQSKLMVFPVPDRDVRVGETSDDFRFAATVAAFGMILRDSDYKGELTLDGVLELAEESRGHDDKGYRAEFIELVRHAKALR